MPWFKVDDGLHAHKKAVKAGVEAMGLWVMAGSWSANLLTDGFVPDYVAARLDPNHKKHAAALVRAGFWVIAEHEGDKGWRFHDWSSLQPSSESVRAKRDEAKARMQRVRANRTPGSQDVRANTSRTDETRDGDQTGGPLENRSQNGNDESSPLLDRDSDSQPSRGAFARTSREVRSTPTRPEPVSTNGPSGGNGRNAQASEPPTDGPPGVAERIVTGWLHGLAARPPGRVVERVGAEVADAIRSGVNPAYVAEGVALWQRNGRTGAGAIPGFIHQIANPGQPAIGADVVPFSGRASPRPSTTDQRVSEGLALAAKYRAIEAEEASS